MIWKTKIMKKVKLSVRYQDSKGFERFISRMDVYFVAVTVIKDMVSHIFHVLSQAKEFEEPNYHHISVQWWNKYYQVACLSPSNKQFDALEKAVKMLMLHEKEGLPVKLEWFNHLPIYNEEDLPIRFKERTFPECTNYPNLKVEPRELYAFETHSFASYFLQEVVTYDQNLFTDNFLIYRRKYW